MPNGGAIRVQSKIFQAISHTLIITKKLIPVGHGNASILEKKIGKKFYNQKMYQNSPAIELKDLTFLYCYTPYLQKEEVGEILVASWKIVYSAYPPRIYIFIIYALNMNKTETQLNRRKTFVSVLIFLTVRLTIG